MRIHEEAIAAINHRIDLIVTEHIEVMKFPMKWAEKARQIKVYNERLARLNASIATLKADEKLG